MKQETVKALAELKKQIEWEKKGQTACLDNIEDLDVIIKVIDSIPSLEKNLAYGGLVKDVDGNWLGNGCKVMYWKFDESPCSATPGWLHYDIEMYQWFLEQADGYFESLQYYNFIREDRFDEYARQQISRGGNN